MPKKSFENPQTEPPKPAKPLIDKITASTGSYPSIILHTLMFAGFLISPLFGVMEVDQALLILTTVVSLEAIYLALFIQMSVNRNTESLESVEEDISEIQEDVEDISEEVEEISEDLEEIQEDVEEISESQEEIEKEVQELGEEVGEISEDVEDLEEDTDEEKKRKEDQRIRLEKIESTLEILLKEISNLKK